MRNWVKLTDGEIASLEGKIKYVHGKEQEALSKYHRLNARMQRLEWARERQQQHQELQDLARRRLQEETLHKKTFNQLLKEHLKCNKEIVFSLFYEKKRENGNETRIHRLQISEIASRNSQSLLEQNLEKAAQVREEEHRVRLNRGRFQARRMEDIRRFKRSQERLKGELTDRERAVIERLEQKEAELLARVKETEQFREKCQKHLGTVRLKRNSNKL